MKFLLDTNHWSYLQRGHPSVLAHIKALPPDCLLYMPVVAQAELLAGVELIAAGRRKEELRLLYERIIAETAEVLGIDSRVAERFARIFASLHRAGRRIETNDIWIAAIAQVHECVVVSNDAHFRAIDALIVEDWTT